MDAGDDDAGKQRDKPVELAIGECPLVADSGRWSYLGARTDANVRFRPKADIGCRVVHQAIVLA